MRYDNLTLYWNKTPKAAKSGKLLWNSVQSKQDLIDLQLYSKFLIDKNTQPAIYTCASVRTHSELYIKQGFIDIDTTAGVDKVLENSQLVFRLLPNVLFMQKSFSGKLHICIVFPGAITTEEDYKQEILLHTAIAMQTISKHLGVNYFDEKTPEGKPAIDSAAFNYTQALFVSGNEFIFNDNCVPIEFDNETNYDQIAKLKELHPEFFPDKKIVEKLSLDDEIYTPDGEYDFGITLPKMCIDRNVAVGKDFRTGKDLTGNEVRWRISRIADVLFGPKAKVFCDKYFYCKENNCTKSIYTKVHNNSFNHQIFNWLLDIGAIIRTVEGVIMLERDEYLSKYSNEILAFCQKSSMPYIVAPTGTGKTRLIADTLAKHYNAVVIGPYNSFRAIYNNDMTIVDSNYTDAIPEGPTYMVWDQAAIRMKELVDRVIIVDEAHSLFLERDYRLSAIVMYEFLKNEHKNKTILVSATPEGEVEYFDADIMRFEKKQRCVNVKILRTPNPFWFEHNYISKALAEGWYDRIVLFDNFNGKTLYENFIAEGILSKDDITYLRADRKSTEEYNAVMLNEKLTTQLTICTNVAFAGLNFKNKNERICVISGSSESNATYSEFRQQIGRIRNSKVYAYIVYDTTERNITPLEDRVIMANNLDEVSYICDFNPRILHIDRELLDEKIVKHKLELQHYYEMYGNIDYMKDKWLEYSNINITTDKTTDGDYCGKPELEIKREESDMICDDIANGTYSNKCYTGTYTGNWARALESLKEKNVWITDDIILHLIVAKHGNKLISTVIAELREIVRVCNMSDEQWEHYINAEEQILAAVSPNVKYMQRYKARMKRHKKIRKTYLLYIQNYKEGDVLPAIVNAMIREEKKKQKATKDATSNGGKIGSPKKRVKDLATGIIYDSVSAYAATYGKSISWASKYKDKWQKI